MTKTFNKIIEMKLFLTLGSRKLYFKGFSSYYYYFFNLFASPT
uniref:Uncharacterized protein n=1 Tax=Rhizophora mucronata TaxID=61149 RepID=A0A2P2PNG8_RHIMU